MGDLAKQESLQVKQPSSHRGSDTFLTAQNWCCGAATRTSEARRVSKRLIWIWRGHESQAHPVLCMQVCV